MVSSFLEQAQEAKRLFTYRKCKVPQIHRYGSFAFSIQIYFFFKYLEKQKTKHQNRVQSLQL